MQLGIFEAGHAQELAYRLDDFAKRSEKQAHARAIVMVGNIVLHA